MKPEPSTSFFFSLLLIGSLLGALFGSPYVSFAQISPPFDRIRRGGGMVQVNSSGVVTIQNNAGALFKWPTADGAVGQFIKTDGAGNLSFAAGGGAPVGATYITQTPHADLSAEQALNSLTANSMLRVTTGGVVAITPLSSDGTNVTLESGQLGLPAGTDALPSLHFGTVVSGFRRSGNHELVYVNNSIPKYFWDNNQFVVADASGIGWSSTTSALGVVDLQLLRDGAADILAQKRGNNNQTHRWYSTNSSYTEKRPNNELHTLALAATSSTTIQFPANSLGIGASFRIITTITGPTSVQVGVSGDATRYGTFSTLTAGQTIAIARSDNYASATAILFTAVGGNFTAGVIRTVISHETLSAPTS